MTTTTHNPTQQSNKVPTKATHTRNKKLQARQPKHGTDNNHATTNRRSSSLWVPSKPLTLTCKEQRGPFLSAGLFWRKALAEDSLSTWIRKGEEEWGRKTETEKDRHTEGLDVMLHFHINALDTPLVHSDQDAKFARCDQGRTSSKSTGGGNSRALWEWQTVCFPGHNTPKHLMS